MWKATLGFSSVFFALLFARACFVAGTPLLTPDGDKPLDELREGDEILTRAENNPEAPVVARRILSMFTHSAFVVEITVNGRVIGTTAEHPFWVLGKGWTLAKELQVGDPVLTHDSRIVPVQAVAETKRFETVYNVEVAEHHSYFVGERKWGWSVWAHNGGCRGGGRRGVVRVEDSDLTLISQRRTAYEVGEQLGRGKLVSEGHNGIKFTDTNFVGPQGWGEYSPSGYPKGWSM